MPEEKLEETPAPEITFRTKAEFTDHMSKKAAEIVGPKNRQIESLTAELETAKAAAARVAELEEQIAGKTQSAAQQFDSERATWEKQQQALQAQIEHSQAETSATRERWHNTARRDAVVSAALKSGALKDAIPDIASLFPAAAVKIEETDNGLRASFVDPETGLPRDANEAMGAWLEARPHYRDKPNGGSGSPGAKAPKPTGPKDALEGKTEAQQFHAAFGSEGN